MKPTLRQYFWGVLLVLLAACGQQVVAQPIEPPIQTVISPTLVSTSTFIPVTIIPTPLPTQTLIPMNTPEPIQVERWREYQTAFAGQLDYRPPENILCEWELLGRSGNEVYVWAICGEIWGDRQSLESLVVIYSLENGSVAGALRSEDRNMFPLDVQQKYFGGLIHFQELVDHLRWRQRHPEEPPLLVLNATPTP